MSKKAIFLDRDGVLIYDPVHLKKISQVKILPKVTTALKKLQKLRYLLVIISNQSAVARSLLTKNELLRIDKYLKRIFKKKGIFLDKSFYCPHHPDFTGSCNCRKPNPGLFLKAIKSLKIEVKKSWTIGDKITDIEAGRRAKCPNLILLPRNLKTWDETRLTYKYLFLTANNLKEAVNIIKSKI